MSRVYPLRPIGPYEENKNWMFASSESANANPHPLSAFMARYQFVRLAQEMYAKTTAEGVAGLIESAKKLQQTAKSMLQPEQSSLEKRQANSGDPSAIAAKAAPGAERRTREVWVEAIAREQVNSGASFVKGSQTSIRSGWNEFDIRTEGHTARVSLWIQPDDTHEKALNKMKAAINSTDGGVSAHLIAGEADNRLTLELHGNKTGKANWFTVSDANGNAVAATGSHLVSQTAKDAEYRVDDGPLQVSETNQVNLDQGRLALTLKRSTGGRPVRVTVTSDAEAVAGQLHELTGRYNELLDRVSSTSGYINPALMHRVRNVVPKEGLGLLGLEKQPDGKLMVDRPALAARLEADPGAISAELQGTAGLPARLDKLAARLQASPADALLDQQNPDYLRYANYQSTLELYSQLPFDGLLVNRYM